MINSSKFYTLETEQRKLFYQVPKQFMHKDSKYFLMKAETKLIYGVLADRNSLSIENGWYDEKGRIFFLFNQKDLSNKLGITPKTLRKRLEELEEYGLLFRDRSGGTLADFLYLLQLDFENLSKEKVENGGSKKLQILTRINARKYKYKNSKNSVENGKNKRNDIQRSNEVIPTEEDNLCKKNNIGVNVENNQKNNVEPVENTMMGKIYPSCSVKFTHHDRENLPPNNTKENNTKENNNTTTTKDYNNIQKSTDKKSSSSSVNLNLKNITKTNITRLKLSKDDLELLERYVLISNYDDLDKFTYYVAKKIKTKEITLDDLRAVSKKSSSTKSRNSEITNFKDKNYNYTELEDELAELDYDL